MNSAFFSLALIAFAFSFIETEWYFGRIWNNSPEEKQMVWLSGTRFQLVQDRVIILCKAVSHVSAVRGLWPAQVAMVVTMTTMENMREMPRRGCERINGQDQGLPRVSGFQWSYRQGFKTMLEDLPSTFHYLHWCDLRTPPTQSLSFIYSALGYSEEGNGERNGGSSIST